MRRLEQFLQLDSRKLTFTLGARLETTYIFIVTLVLSWRYFWVRKCVKRVQTAGANTSGGATKNAIFHARPYPLIYTSECLELLPGAELISAK